MTARLRAVTSPPTARHLNEIYRHRSIMHAEILTRHAPHPALRLQRHRSCVFSASSPISVICILIGCILRKSFIVRSADGCICLNIAGASSSVAAAAAAAMRRWYFYMNHRWVRRPQLCAAECITIIGIRLLHIFSFVQLLAVCVRVCVCVCICIPWL